METRTYFPAEEFVWHTPSGATAGALRAAVSAATGVPLDKLVIAKHVPEIFDWMLIKDTHTQVGVDFTYTDQSLIP